MRFIDGLAVISGLSAPGSTSLTHLKVGDVITELDGVPVGKLLESWKQYYPASNDSARLRDIARSMTRGACGQSSIRIRRGSQEFEIKIQRVPLTSGDSKFGTHDLPGPTFRLLSKDVAYLKLSSVKSADAATYIAQASGTKGLIIDIRNYPSEFVVFALRVTLVKSDSVFARFTTGDRANPGAFHWTGPVMLVPQQPHYAGKIVILADEMSMSQAEYTSMAFRSAPGAIVVGSTTAGADGNVSPFALPGGLRTAISGIGVFYPDEMPTQGLGSFPTWRLGRRSRESAQAEMKCWKKPCDRFWAIECLPPISKRWPSHKPNCRTELQNATHHRGCTTNGFVHLLWDFCSDRPDTEFTTDLFGCVETNDRFNLPDDPEPSRRKS